MCRVNIKCYSVFYNKKKKCLHFVNCESLNNAWLASKRLHKFTALKVKIGPGI